jgi:hypothetical protein
MQIGCVWSLAFGGDSRQTGGSWGHHLCKLHEWRNGSATFLQMSNIYNERSGDIPDKLSTHFSSILQPVQLPPRVCTMCGSCHCERSRNFRPARLNMSTPLKSSSKRIAGVYKGQLEKSMSNDLYTRLTANTYHIHWHLGHRTSTSGEGLERDNWADSRWLYVRGCEPTIHMRKRYQLQREQTGIRFHLTKKNSMLFSPQLYQPPSTPFCLPSEPSRTWHQIWFATSPL